MALTFVVSIEVFKRYILNAPTAWIFDFNNMLYGTLFMMCGAYTLAAAGHVRADFVYIYLKPRGQAALDLALYLLFFIPGILGLIYAGTDYAADSWRIGEHSTVTAEGPPVYHFKSVIPLAGALVMLQGLAEILRCVVCLRTGAWPARLEDVEEIDVIDTQLGHSEYVDEESRRAAMEGAHAIDEAARHRSVMDESERPETDAVSDPSLGLTMLGLIVVAIMMGFPTAFTLMGLGMVFGYIAFWIPGQHWYDNRAFDLIVQRTYGVMTNDTLLSVPLFVFMGYIMERAALVDRMFHSVQLAFRRVPASLAVTTLLVCAFWGIASGIVGAVVVLMGVIAMRPMLNAGYDVRLASGAITAGGTLGILIPPSVMLIVYAAVAGQSIVKLYAAAMLPGFFLTFLYLVYILGWAIINPKIAPKLPPDQYRVDGAGVSPARSSAGRSRSVVPGLLAAALPARAGARRRAGLPRADRARRRCALAVPAHAHGRAPSPRPGGTWSSTTRPRRSRPRRRRRRRAAPPPPRRRRARGPSPRAAARGEAAGARRGGRLRGRPTSPRSSGPPASRRLPAARSKTEGPPEEMTSLAGADRGRRRGQDPRALLRAGSGGWPPLSALAARSSTSGAWTASSSRSSRS